MKNSKTKFSFAAFGVGILLLLVAAWAGYSVYEDYFGIPDYHVINIKAILFFFALLLGAGSAFYYSFRAPADKTVILFLPLRFKEALKKAVMSGSNADFEGLLGGERVEYPNPECSALVFKQFAGTPKTWAVQFLHKRMNTTTNIFESVEQTAYVPISESVLPVIERLKQHYGFHLYGD